MIKTLPIWGKYLIIGVVSLLLITAASIKIHSNHLERLRNSEKSFIDYKKSLTSNDSPMEIQPERIDWDVVLAEIKQKQQYYKNLQEEDLKKSREYSPTIVKRESTPIYRYRRLVYSHTSNSGYWSAMYEEEDGSYTKEDSSGRKSNIKFKD
jgi:hypothetical protein